VSQTKTAIENTPAAAGPLGLPRSFWLLWVGTLVNRLGGAVFPFLALYLTRDRGLSPALAGTAVSLYAAGGAIAGPVGGALSDRIGRRPSLLAATVLAAAAMLALAGVRAIPLVLLMAPVLGFFTDLAKPSLHAAIADLVPPADRTRAFGLVYWAINLGFAGAAALAGALAEWSFMLLFVIDAVTTLAFGAIVFLGVPESRPRLAAPTAAAAPRRTIALLVPFYDRAFVTFAVVQLLVLVVFQQGVVALPLDMRAHGLSTAAIGQLLALNGIVIIALQPFGVKLLRRRSRTRALAWGAALTGTGFGLLALAGGAPIYAAGIVVFTLGEIAFSTAAPALIADLAPPAHRGAYQGANLLTWSLTGVVAPALGSAVLGAWGAVPLWIACAVTGAALHATLTGRAARAHDRASST
jgi:MFS family permease